MCFPSSCLLYLNLYSCYGWSSERLHFPVHLITLFPGYQVKFPVVLVTKHNSHEIIIVCCCHLQRTRKVYASKMDIPWNQCSIGKGEHLKTQQSRQVEDFWLLENGLSDFSNLTISLRSVRLLDDATRAELKHYASYSYCACVYVFLRMVLPKLSLFELFIDVGKKNLNMD